MLYKKLRELNIQQSMEEKKKGMDKNTEVGIGTNTVSSASCNL